MPYRLTRASNDPHGCAPSSSRDHHRGFAGDPWVGWETLDPTCRCWVLRMDPGIRRVRGADYQSKRHLYARNANLNAALSTPLTNPANMSRAGRVDPVLGGGHVRTKGRKENVKVLCDSVRKVSTKGPTRPALFSFKLTMPSEDCAAADSMRS